MKFSIIGTNWITGMFINAAKETGIAKLNTVYSRTKSSAEQFAEKHGANNWNTDMSSMLNDDSDFVYIASPNLLHYEQVLASINKGTHVFCEEAMGFTEDQINHVQTQASAKVVFVFEGYRHLFSPNYQQLKDNLKNVGK